MKSDSEVVILNETSPLQNNKEQPFLYRSASSEVHFKTSDSSAKLIAKMDDSSKRILIRISMDVIILCIGEYKMLYSNWVHRMR